MPRYAAFLRGMNLGRRRISNAALCTAFETLGFEDVSAFLASGNVVFRADAGPTVALEARLAAGLAEQLGYPVPAFVRTAGEVRAIAGLRPFGGHEAASNGKPQVALLARRPTAAARERARALATPADRLAIRGRALHWLPSGPLTASDLEVKTVEAILGSLTIRARRTIERLTARYLSA